jgi:hypothetical protein
LQWWCRTEEPARPAIEALEAGRVRYHPDRTGSRPSRCRTHPTGACRASSGGSSAAHLVRRTPAICARRPRRSSNWRRGRPDADHVRHVVLLGAVAVCHPRLAGRHPELRRTTRGTTRSPRRSSGCEENRAGLGRSRDDGEVPFTDVIIH